MREVLRVEEKTEAEIEDRLEPLLCMLRAVQEFIEGLEDKQESEMPKPTEPEQSK